MKHLLTIVLTTALATQATAQTFVVQPYLQDAEPNSIRIMWETTSGEESTVIWGETEGLGNETTGMSFSSVGSAMMHDVQLVGLERFTTYYYSVVTGAAVSNLQKFKTPPFASDNENFRFVAMSDMQRSGSDPYVYDEIIHDGVLDYLEEHLSGVVSDDLALVLIPGDLVDNGNSYYQWETQFFEQSSDLFGQVPVYPVLGNHEVNTQYYYQYFHLPENGTEGYEEHWWWKDYGNVRFVGLDSNGPYDGEAQLEWLDQLLTNTCSSDSIDFVFAELHHPYKSELWTPGESDFTGEVVERMEAFSQECGKPSIHFFGHTHGYSRGQSRDHKHVWINVATAGGAIDYWGDWPQADYEEFTVSEDDWGWVLVEVEAGAEPKFTVKRLSRGNGNVNLDNELFDSFTVTKIDYEISTPIPIQPIDITVAPECVVLYGSPFDTEDMHGAAHWQVTAIPGDYGSPLNDVWEQFENIYFNEDTREGEVMTNEAIHGLPENTQLWWRVRYRDKELNWSDWCDEVSFTTGESTMSENLLQNPGAESEMAFWQVDLGVCEAMLGGDCAGTNPYVGNKYFSVGGLCSESAVGIMHQDIDISSYTDSVDMGVLEVSFGAMMSDWSGADLPQMRLQFLTQGGMEIGSTEYLDGAYSSWTLISTQTLVPLQTRTIRCELKGTRNEGVDNDCYFDEIFVKAGSTEVCDSSIVEIETVHPPERLSLLAYPNPAVDSVTIEGYRENLQVRVVDSSGRKVEVDMTINAELIVISRGDLPAGVYRVIVLGRDGSVGTVSVSFE